MNTSTPTPEKLSPADLAKATAILQKGRMVFRVRSPYWWGTLCKLIPCPSPGLGTFGITNRGQFMYDPAAVLKWGDNKNEDVIAGVIAHEVMHVILQFWARVGNRDLRRFNIAQDLYINGLLREVGWKLPDCGVFPEQFNHKDTGQPLPPGLTADQYYEILPEHINGGGGSAATEGNGQTGPCSGRCGSGAGNPFDNEPAAGELGADGERSPEEMRAIVEQAARDTANSKHKDAGTIPGDISKWAEQSLAPPIIYWYDKLSYSGRRVIAKAGRGRNTYARPHRRQACMGRGARVPILPSRNSTQCDIWFAIDTSGSMGIGTELRRAVSELKGILQNRAGAVHILACDAAVQGKPKRIRTVAEALPMLTGDGGTNFCPIFEEALGMPPKKRPDLIVVATDGYGPAPQSDPGIPTIWLIIGDDPDNARSPATWGELIAVGI